MTGSNSRSTFTDLLTPCPVLSSLRLNFFGKRESFVEANMEAEMFPSLTVDINSPTPNTDATQVETLPEF